MTGKITSSFIDETVDLSVIRTKNELLELIQVCKEKDKRLMNLDLSHIDDCSNINFDGLHIENVVFSRFDPEKTTKTFLSNLSFVGAKLLKVGFAQASLQQCNFDTADEKAINFNIGKQSQRNASERTEKCVNTELKEVDFFYCDLNYCRFCSTYIETADFRYSHIKDCSMRNLDARICDFYFCAFEGCSNFQDSIFRDCSFTCAIFEHNCVRMNNIPEGIIQEHSDVYHNKLIGASNWVKYHPCASFSNFNREANSNSQKQKSESNIALEAADFYKNMSGIYSGKGLNRDSNEAYRLSKIYELKFCKLELKLPVKERKIPRSHLLSRIIRLRITQTFGYGFKWQAPTLWFIGIVVVYGFIGLIRAHFEGIINGEHFCGFSDSIKALCYSLYNSMSPHEGFIKIVSLPWASFESVMGVLLIGFLGFIIANNIRNDS